MARIARILLLVGLALLLCSPAVAFSQAGRPVKQLVCATAEAPVIDGDLDEAFWDTAHWEQIPYFWLEGAGAQQAQDISFGIGHDLTHLYVAVVEYWPEADAVAAQLPPYSQFSLFFEDENPLWEWNQENPNLWSDEGQFWFFAPTDGSQPECAYRQAFGGIQTDMPFDCRGKPIRPAPGVEYAFDVYLDGAGPHGVHEAAIDLANSPLDLNVQRGPCFTAVFQSWPALRTGEPASMEEAFTSLLEGPEPLADRPVAVWPEDFWDSCPPAEQWATCSECIDLHGRICVDPCPEEVEEVFVPEPASMLLLGTGLMGLGGYVRLRIRRR